MATRKFKVTVKKEYEFVISLDDEHITEEVINDLDENFWPTENLEEYAAHLAEQIVSREDQHGFLEGFGILEQRQGIAVEVDMHPDFETEVEELEDEEDGE